MGHRANFVVIRNHQVKAFYDQWAARGCIYSFAGGPAEALQALTDFEPTSELMDWAFAEGGYLLDFDEKKAVVFGYPMDDELLDEMEGEAGSRLRALNNACNEGGLAFLQHISGAWTGWKLVWDDRGVDAFAIHLTERNLSGIAISPKSHPAETAPPFAFQA